jgi:hypothetical protein
MILKLQNAQGVISNHLSFMFSLLLVSGYKAIYSGKLYKRKTHTAISVANVLVWS